MCVQMCFWVFINTDYIKESLIQESDNLGCAVFEEEPTHKGDLLVNQITLFVLYVFA